MHVSLKESTSLQTPSELSCIMQVVIDPNLKISATFSYQGKKIYYLMYNKMKFHSSLIFSTAKTRTADPGHQREILGGTKIAKLLCAKKDCKIAIHQR